MDGPINLTPLLADLPQAQLLMVGGFLLLGWVLARRQIQMRRRAQVETRSADRAIQQMRDDHNPSVPLINAPAETQRWQVAMFDLQRDLKAELDTRISIVQTLIRQLDERMERLAAMESERSDSAKSGPGRD